VLTPEGERPIEELMVGDQVVTLDPETGVMGTFPVLETRVRLAPSVVEVSLAGAGGQPSSVRATPGHPFWTLDRGWVQAADLSPEESLAEVAGDEVHVLSVAAVPLEAPVYNIDVAQVHTYVVGKAHALVHNWTPCALTPDQVLQECPSCVNPQLGGRQCLFWSGPGTEAIATNWANKNPRNVVAHETTRCYRCMQRIQPPIAQYEYLQNLAIWETSSGNYASACRGTVQVVIDPRYDPCSAPPRYQARSNPAGVVWSESEYPALNNNPNVTQICYVTGPGQPLPNDCGGLSPGCVSRDPATGNFPQ
jgi:hypothetical protein